MALQTTGAIKLSHVNVELTLASNTLISIGGTESRLLSGISSGAASMSNFYGRSYIFYGTISTNQKELNLATWAAANGWTGEFPAVITINAGVYIWSDNTAVAALTTGVFPRGLTIINNGYIMGRGGNGGLGNSGPASSGFEGGPAISLGSSVTLSMAGTTSYIGGGGGGGGGNAWGGGGGGAGGGPGGSSFYSGTQTGGAGGSVGAAGGDGGARWSEYNESGQGGTCGGGGGTGRDLKGTDNCTAGGGGGRIFPGAAVSSPGGDGGGPGDSGVAGTGRGGGGGGGWGAAGGSASYAGGAAGKAIDLNGYTATLSGGTTRIYGAVS